MPFSLASTQHLAPAMTLVAPHGLQAIQGHLPPILSASASYRAAERAPRQGAAEASNPQSGRRAWYRIF
jgi:hypothetical protein